MYCGSLKKQSCRTMLSLVHHLCSTCLPARSHPSLCPVFAGSALRMGGKGRKRSSEGHSRLDCAASEPRRSAALRETTAFLVTGGSPQALYNSSFIQTKSRGQEKLYEVTFPLPSAKLKSLFNWELSPEPLDRNLFELRAKQKQF